MSARFSVDEADKGFLVSATAVLFWGLASLREELDSRI
jgi:hypothetical protein